MQNPNAVTRRSLLQQSITGASSLLVADSQIVRGAGNDKLKAGLVGCGGRGTQAVVDMLTGNENVELVAMADVFEDHLEGALAHLRDAKNLGRYAGITVERGGQPRQLSGEDLAASI